MLSMPLTRPHAAERDLSAKFRLWFGSSKVVDAQGAPLVVYHGTPTHGRESSNRYVRAELADIEFRKFEVFRTRCAGITDSLWLGEGAYFTPCPEKAFQFGNFLMPVYLSLKRPFLIYDDCSASQENHFRFLRSLRTLERLPEELVIDLTIPATVQVTDHSGRQYSRYYWLRHAVNMEITKRWALLSSHSPEGRVGVVESYGTTPEEAIFGFRYRYQFAGFLLHTIIKVAFRELLECNGYDGVIRYGPIYDPASAGWKIREAVAFRPNQIKSSVGNSGAFDPNNSSILG